VYSRSEIENKLKRIKPELESNFHVKNIGYFGSFSEEKQTETSDLDILVEFKKPIGWDYFTLERYLEHQLGLRIDMVTVNALKDRIRENILKQVRYI